MSDHAYLLQQGQPLESKAHLDLVLQRKGQCEADHGPRLQQLRVERKIITGDVFDKPQVKGERRVTSGDAHNITQTNADMTLPRAPTFSVVPLSKQQTAMEEADAVLRWVNAVLYASRAQLAFRHWVKHMMSGVGGLHMIPDPLAMDDELPVLLDTPDPAALLYEMGARHKPRYVFIKHRMTVGALKATFGHTPKKKGRDTDKIDTHCYYAEDRYRDPQSGKVHKLISYGVLYGNEWVVPLQDVTIVLPDIPVFLAFNSDGYVWQGREDMRAWGVLSNTQTLLLYGHDMLNQLANQMVRVVNPPLAYESTGQAQKPKLDLNPGKVNDFANGEKVTPIYGIQPSPEVMAWFPQVGDLIAGATLPQIRGQKSGDINGISGTMMSENMQPATLRTAGRQDNLMFPMTDFVSLMMRHMAAVTDPEVGHFAWGLDPRDRKAVAELIKPDQLLNNCRVLVRLPNQTPRMVTQYINTIQQLGSQGYLPRSLVAEQAAELMNLPVSDFSSLMEETKGDELWKIKLQMFSQEALGQFRQHAYNKMQNPQLTDDGHAPQRGSSEAQDPRQWEETDLNGPIQQAIFNAQGAS